MSESRLVTVVVLTYNRKRYLVDCLKAIQDQTLADIQVLVLDNASEDGTEEVVTPFLDDPRFSYFRHRENIGATGNYNFALRVCTTKYLCITHDDDIVEPRFLEVLLQRMEVDRQVNLAFCNTMSIDGEGAIVRNPYFSEFFGLQADQKSGTMEFTRRYIEGTLNIVCPAVLLRILPIHQAGLQFVEAVGPAADTHFWMQLNLLEGDFLYVHEVLYRYRLHSGQDSSLSAAVLGTKLYRPGLRLLLRHSAFLEARAWRRRFIRDIFVDWAEAAYQNRRNAEWGKLREIQWLQLGAILGVLLRLIPPPGKSQIVFRHLVTINILRFEKYWRILRTLFARENNRT